MYADYLSIDGVEIINAARITAYLKKFQPQLDTKDTSAGLRTALAHGIYADPAPDLAPWYRASRPASVRFYGLYPNRIQGVEDSTRQVPVSELSGDGAIHTIARSGAREMRFTVTAFAADAEAMNEGLAWLRDALAGDGCGAKTGISCTGHTVKMFTALPTTTAEAAARTRNFYKVELTEGPLVIRRLAAKTVLMWEIEFTLTAGRPWAFTAPSAAGTLNMDTATSFTDPAGEDCSVAASAYDDFVGDPYFTAISKPPRPPVILPPNIITISSWRRHSLAIPAAQTDRWGRVVPVVNISTTNAAQYIRLRFYPPGKSGCDFDGEFLVSYIPANSVLKLDGIRREVTVTQPSGKVSPGNNLLFGSNGRPFAWPSLGCQKSYTMTADMMPGQTGIVVLLDTAVRE